MRNYYILFIFVISGLFFINVQAQEDQKAQDLPKEKTEMIKVDNRIDNMGYWKRLIELEIVKGNPSIPVKPAEYKGSTFNSKSVPVDSPDVAVWNESGVTQSENSVFVDPNDNQHVLNSNNSEQSGSVYGANYIYSYDAGQNWSGSKQGAGGGNSGDPAAVIGTNGRRYVGFIYNSGQAVSRTPIGSYSSWTRYVVDPGPGGWDMLDKNHLWIDNSTSSSYQGNLYDAWTRFESGHANDMEIELSRSTDSGISWPSNINISSAVSAGSHNQGVNIQTSPNGEVYVVWAIYDSWPSNETSLGMAKSTDGGFSFANATRIISGINGIRNSGVSKNMRVNSFPSMAVDISGGIYSGNVYVTWTNYGDPNNSNSGTNKSVYLIRSSNGGSSWSSPIRVNQGAFTDGKEAYFGWITSDPSTGYLYVVFYDDRNTSSSSCEAWVAISEDAGATWEDFRVSDVSFSPSPIPGLASGYFGDYLGITARDGWVYPCWTDNRSGRALTYVSTFQYPPPAPDQWNGSTSTNWNTGSNWDDGTVPTSSDDVIIPTSATNWPTFSGNMTLGTTCRDITIQGSGQLSVTGNFTIPSGRTLTVEASGLVKVGGDWDNDGTFDMGTGTVDFYYNTPSVIYTPPGGPVYLINNDISTWPGSWSGDIGTGQGQFSQQSSSYAGGSSPEARFYWQSGTATKQMIHSAVNTSGLTSLTLDFKHMVNDYSGSAYTVKVQYSTDGSSWNDVWSVSPSGNISATTISIPLTTSEGVGSSTYYISFTITGNLYNINYWYIDDVQLYYPGVGVETFYNLSVSKNNAEALTNGDIDVNNDFTVKPGARFTNVTGNTMDVAGNAIFEGTVAGKASFVDNGTFIVTGTTTAQSYYTDNRWHYISSPVSNAVSNIFLNMYLYYWNEANYTWTYIAATDSLLRVGKGYGLYTTIGNTTVNYTGGYLNTGNIPASVTATDSDGGGIGPDEGWNFVGNPYPSAIDLGVPGNVLPGYTWTNLTYTVYLYNGSGYSTYNPNTGASTNSGTRYVPSMQGFYVKATASPPALTIPNSARLHSGQANYKSFEDYQMLRLAAQGNGYSDEMLVMANANATVGFDSDFDAYKMMGIDEAPQLYCIADETNFAVNTLPEINEESIVKLGLRVGEETSYTISLTELEKFEGFDFIILEDIQTNTFVNLLEYSSYSFSASAEDEQHRFNLYFKDIAAGVGENLFEGINIWSYNDIVYIQTPLNINGDIIIYDMVGHEILQQKTNGEGLNQIKIERGTGYYLVKVQIEKILVVEKFFIR